MYYDNKSTFYIKQYGPAVFVIVISLVLVLSGLYIYLSSNRNNRPQDTLVAKSDTQEQTQQVQAEQKKEETSSLKEEPVVEEKKEETTLVTAVQEEKKVEEPKNIDLNNIKISNVLTSELRALNKLEKSVDCTVLGVNDNKNLVINISDKNYEIALIGVDYKKSSSDIKNKMTSDLANKKVKIAFDNVKTDNSKLCAYVYLDDKLYNETLLKDGLAILKVEKANTSLLNELVNAQKYAKSNNLGIWNK